MGGKEGEEKDKTAPALSKNLNLSYSFNIRFKVRYYSFTFKCPKFFPLELKCFSTESLSKENEFSFSGLNF